MSTTIYQEGRQTISVEGAEGAMASRCPEELLARYAELLQGARLS